MKWSEFCTHFSLFVERSSSVTARSFEKTFQSRCFLVPEKDVFFDDEEEDLEKCLRSPYKVPVTIKNVDVLKDDPPMTEITLEIINNYNCKAIKPGVYSLTFFEGTTSKPPICMFSDDEVEEGELDGWIDTMSEKDEYWEDPCIILVNEINKLFEKRQTETEETVIKETGSIIEHLLVLLTRFNLREDIKHAVLFRLWEMDKSYNADELSSLCFDLALYLADL